MIVDLHTHYPMHVLAADPGIAPRVASPLPPDLLHRLRRVILRIANEVANYPNDGREPAVTAARLRESPIRIALSVLYIPFDEMDLDATYGSPPAPHYFANLLDLLQEINHHVATSDSEHVAVATSLAEARAIAASGRTALIHAVEGGFHLGDTQAAIEANVAELAARGVAYVTVAHLFWRQIATNAPAIPFISDQSYDQLFPQPESGLGELGHALLREMVRNGILIDVAHMSRDALGETMALLEVIDPAKRVPVFSTHGACRAINDTEYNLHDDDIASIMARDGVIGLIASSHWMSPNGRTTRDIDESVGVLLKHIDHIEHLATRAGRRVGHHYTAIGSDQDGFIKPPLAGLELPSGYARVAEVLNLRYGEEAAERICRGNAERVLQSWGVRV